MSRSTRSTVITTVPNATEPLGTATISRWSVRGPSTRFLRPVTHQLQHLKSSAHRGSNISCPLCMQGFTTATGVVHHLERGACPNTNNMNRNTLYKFVRAKDPHGVISKKLIGWHEESKYEATDRAWNGYGYKCYFCNRLFSQLSGLNQHLRSPVRKYNPRPCWHRNSV